MATRWNKLFPVLQSTKLDKVFTDGIVATRGTRFAHLATAMNGSGGW
jgi:hypothetical protein